MSLHYYIIDTETTGLKPRHHEITQISIIRCSDRHQLNKYIRAEHPERATYKALEITGRTMSDIVSGEQKEDVVKFCQDFIEQDGQTPEARCFVAHNADFDKRFCFALWESVGMKFPSNLWLCTKVFTGGLANKLGIYKPKLTLEASCKLAGVKTRSGAHNAAVDAQNTYFLWDKLMNSDVDYLNYIKRMPHIIENETSNNFDLSDL